MAKYQISKSREEHLTGGDAKPVVGAYRRHKVRLKIFGNCIMSHKPQYYEPQCKGLKIFRNCIMSHNA